MLMATLLIYYITVKKKKKEITNQLTKTECVDLTEWYVFAYNDKVETWEHFLKTQNTDADPRA